MTDSTAYLLDELAALRAQNKELRRRVLALTRGRDRWRQEAIAWKWGCLHKYGELSPPFTALSPTERAEASEVV